MRQEGTTSWNGSAGGFGQKKGRSLVNAGKVPGKGTGRPKGLKGPVRNTDGPEKAGTNCKKFGVNEDAKRGRRCWVARTLEQQGKRKKKLKLKRGF